MKKKEYKPKGFRGLTDLKIHKKHRPVALHYDTYFGFTSLCEGCTCVLYYGEEKPFVNR